MKQKGKRWVSILLSVCMVFSLLPNTAWGAEGNAHTAADHNTWIGLTQIGYSLSGGNYYLSGDVTAGNFQVYDTVTLCLNGHKLEMGSNNTITVGKGAVLNLCDCTGTGTVTVTENMSQRTPLFSVNEGALHVSGGTIQAAASPYGGTMIKVDDGEIQVSGGRISLVQENAQNSSLNGIHLTGSSKGSFTGGEVSLSTDMDSTSFRITAVYQQGGTVTLGGNAEITFTAGKLSQMGYGGVYVTDGGQLTVQGDCSIQSQFSNGLSAGALCIGSGSDSTANTVNMTGGSINFVQINTGNEATVSGGNIGGIMNLGTLTMTGGTLGSEDAVFGERNGVLRNQGRASLENVEIFASRKAGTGISQNSKESLTVRNGVSINAGVGIAVSSNMLLPTIEEGVTIDAEQYGVQGGAVLQGAPSIHGGTADFYTSSINVQAAENALIQADAYTGGEITVQEVSFPDIHTSGYTGYAVKTTEDKANVFTLKNGGEHFTYQYHNGAVRLYNKFTHAACGDTCSHGDSSHSDVNWQPWTDAAALTEGSYYLTKNITLADEESVSVTGEVHLCLNGYTINGSSQQGIYNIGNGGTLTICDCSEEKTGTIKGDAGVTPVTLQGAGSLYLYSGNVETTGAAAVKSAGTGVVQIEGGSLSGTYGVDLGEDAALVLSGAPVLSGSAADLKLYTKGETTLSDAKVNAAGYTGEILEAEEADISAGVGGYAICGGENRFTLKNGGEYLYAYENGGYMIRPKHTHSYVYQAQGAEIIETCTGCSHQAKAALVLKEGENLTYTGTPITPAAVQYDTGWAGGELEIAYESNVQAGTAKASITKENAWAVLDFVIQKGSQTPPETDEGYTIDYTEETITVENGYEIRKEGEEAWEQGEKTVILTPGTVYELRKTEKDNFHPSESLCFTAAARPAAPGNAVSVTGESIKGKEDGKVSVPEGMEYSGDEGVTWESGPAEVEGLAAGEEILVRKKATAAAPHGEQQAYVVPKGTRTLCVIFAENGGTAVEDIAGLSYNEMVEAPEISRVGYDFEGWYKDNTKWDFSAGVTEDMTLTARWKLRAPFVELTGSKTEVTYGESITLEATVSHDGEVDFRYQWFKDGKEIPGEGKSLTVQDVRDSGAYSVKVTAGDGSQEAYATSNTVQVTIGKATPILSVENVTITYGNILEDGLLHGTAEWNGHAVSGAFSWGESKGGTMPSVGESGSYTVVFTPADRENYTEAEKKIVVTVNKATLIPAVSSVNSKVYDGERDTTGKISLSGAVGDDTPSAQGMFTFADADAGEDKPVMVSVALDEAWEENYRLSSAALETTADIAKRPVTLTWSGYESLEYNGEAAAVTAAAGNLVGEDVCTVTVTGGQEREAGTHRAEATALSNDNYCLPDTGFSKEYTIAPRPVQLTWSEESFTYDGQEKTVTAAVANKAAETDSFQLEYTGSKGTDAAYYTAEVIALGNANYTLEQGSGVAFDWVIQKKQVDIPAADTTRFTYNGKEQTYEIPHSEIYTVSGNRQTKAGTYEVSVGLKDERNYIWSDGTWESKSYTFTIERKQISGTWQGLKQVYGDNEPVQILLNGLEEEDKEAKATISGVGREAGEYTVTASLDNYEILNGTAVLEIQKKPVVAAVTGNGVAPGETPEVSIPDVPEEAYQVIYKDENGSTVENPQDTGSYEIWVKFPEDSNYRHPDGSMEKQVGSFVVADKTPLLYDVIFDGGEGGGSMDTLRLTGGSVLTLPDCGYIKDGFLFTGWEYKSSVYQPGDRVTTAYGTMIFTALWQDVYRVTGTIKEIVDDTGETPETKFAENAVVSLWLGSNKLEETSTDSSGAYTFADLLPGIYNLVVTKDQRIVTKKVEITVSDLTCDAVLPQGMTNSIVEVTPGSPDIVVGDLDRIFETVSESYTQEDAAAVENGGKVEITFTAHRQAENEVTEEIVTSLEKISGSNIGLLLDCTLDKEVYDENGVKDEEASGQISRSAVLLEVRLPLPRELQGKYRYTLSRIHEGEAQILGTAANEQGEYFEVSQDKTCLILHVRCFSTYAVGYKENSGGSSSSGYPPVIEQPEHGTVTVSPKNPQTGDRVTIIPAAEDGYAVDQVVVSDNKGETVKVTPGADGSYSFVQPEGKVTITVTFRQIIDPADCPRDESCPIAAYEDSDSHAWYHDGVHYCIEWGLMVGVDENTFAPDIAVTRAMAVTILWRLEGCPVVDAPMIYTDVQKGSWYEEAVRWADSVGVVTGYGDGTFGPGDAITREQLAAILWRYKGNPETEGELSAFIDGEETSGWARKAMIWMVEQGLFMGVSDNRLDPTGETSRAQGATVFMRFIENVE